MTNTLTSRPPQSELNTETDRRTLIFFVGTDPDVDPGPLQTAQHFAAIAAGAGLETELRLAARSVRKLDEIPTQPQGVDVTVCPRAMQQYDISPDQVQAAGARSRTLAEILTEVADGTAVLIPVTHSVDDPTKA